MRHVAMARSDTDERQERFVGIRDKHTSGREDAASSLVEWLRPLPPAGWRTLFTVLWYAACLSSSVTPGWKAQFHTHEHHHGSLHIVIFFLTELITLALGLFGLRPVASSFAVIALAFATEWLQKVVYMIGFEWKDVAVDIAGILTAALIAGAALALQRYMNSI
jgi:hypothetical protein